MDDAAVLAEAKTSTGVDDLALLAWLIDEVKIAAQGLRLVGASLHAARDELHGDAVALTGTSLAMLHRKLEDTRRRLQFQALGRTHYPAG